MRRLFGLIFASLLVATIAFAAPPGKVTLRMEMGSPQLARGGPTGLDVVAEIARGWHIQAHEPNEPFLIPTELSLDLPAGITAEPVGYPKPDEAEFAFASGKKLLVYEGRVGFATGLHVPADFAAHEVRVQVRLRYQACNDDSCLPPTTAKAEVVVPVADSVAPAELPGKGGGAGAAGSTNVDRWIGEYGYVATFLLVALLGLGLNLTPCVYPLISITISFFGGQGEGMTRRVLWLALVYVAGIALTFSTVGVIAALSGGLFGAALQKPAVLIGIAGLLVALSLSSFGLYQLQPPASVMRVVGGASRGFLGAFVMGLTMGIVAAPCVGPIVVGLLVFVGARHDILLGFSLFLALSLGLGLPYVVLAVAAGSLRKLPRSGEWLMWTEHLFGFVLLGLAVYFITPLLPRPFDLFALPGLIGIAGVYLGFLDGSGAKLRYFWPLKRVVGVAALIVAVWWAWPQPAQSAIGWEPYSKQAFEAARASGQPIIVDFAAAWCIPCKEMEQTTFVDPDVVREAERFHMIKADLTEESEGNDALTAAFDVRGVPTTIVFDRSGKEIDRMVGFVSRDEMLAAMKRAQ